MNPIDYLLLSSWAGVALAALLLWASARWAYRRHQAKKAAMK